MQNELVRLSQVHFAQALGNWRYEFLTGQLRDHTLWTREHSCFAEDQQIESFVQPIIS